MRNLDITSIKLPLISIEYSEMVKKSKIGEIFMKFKKWIEVQSGRVSEAIPIK